jgi:Zn-dependent metalloprotease
VLALGACGRGSAGQTLPPTLSGRVGGVLVASAAWRGNVDAATYKTRVSDLAGALTRLRTATKTGWVGRQDDQTGFLAELSGGTYTSAPEASPQSQAQAFMAAYGPALFGVDASAVSFEQTDGPLQGDGSATVAVRGGQFVQSVPVRDASLLVTVGTSGGSNRVKTVAGRVFPGLAVPSDAAVPSSDAEATAVTLSGGSVSGTSTLVVLPQGAAGVLAWEVPVAGDTVTGGLGSALYYVDATTGTLVSVRPAYADAKTLYPGMGTGKGTAPQRAAAAGAVAAAARQGQAVQVSGRGPDGTPISAWGLKTSDGKILLVDTTAPGYDASSGAGAIETHDATGVAQSSLPGPVYQSNGQQIADPEALAAQAYDRYVIDYYREFQGRRSWDGRGGSLIGSVNYGGSSYCNSSFNGSQMIFGDPCVLGGQPQETTEVEIDTAAHEITHGVTATSVPGSPNGLIYAGQSGALNESFSDYFGNAIGNRLKKSDSAEIYEGSCVGITRPTGFCIPDPEGGLSLRYMLNGNTFADYLYLLDPSFQLRSLGNTQDHGGVHLNSSIWNNALWSIRSQLAKIDSTSGNDSPRVAAFDRIVYLLLTRHLTAGAGFLDARAGLEQAAVEAGADPVILRTIRDQMDADLICTGCVAASGQGTAVAAGSSSEKVPTVGGDTIAWLNLSAGGGATGLIEAASPSQPRHVLSPEANALSVGMAGSRVVAAEVTFEIASYDLNGQRRVLAQLPYTDQGFQSLTLGVAGSSEGAAWVDFGAGQVAFADPSGTVTKAGLGSLASETFVSIGTAGRVVVLGADDGRVVVWKVGSKPAAVGRLSGAVLAVATNGRKLLAVYLTAFPQGTATVMDISGANPVVVSQNVSAFGAAMSADYAVWSEVVGALEGGVARTAGVWPDTDIYVYGLTSGKTYSLGSDRGQQGYPSISGFRLVWQDAGNGGDDVRSTVLPAGL